MISAVLIISFFIFLILGVPIAICLGLSSVCAVSYTHLDVYKRQEHGCGSHSCH